MCNENDVLAFAVNQTIGLKEAFTKGSFRQVRRVLAGFAVHANVGGLLLVEEGSEMVKIDVREAISSRVF